MIVDGIAGNGRVQLGADEDGFVERIALAGASAQMIDRRVGRHQRHERGQARARGVVLAQLAHVVAQERQPHVADEVVEIVPRKGRTMAAQRLDDAGGDQPLVALHERLPAAIVQRRLCRSQEGGQ